MKLGRKWFSAGALFVLVMASAQAVQVNYSFSVRINEIDVFTNDVFSGGLNNTAFPLGGQVSLGDIFTGTFSFDQDKLDLPVGYQTSTSRYFRDAFGGGHNVSFVTPGGASYTTPAANTSGILQLQHESFDYFSISEHDTNFTVGLILANWNGGVFNSLNLPSDMKLADMPYTWFSADWQVTPAQQIAVRGTLVSLTALSPVPEPAAWISLFTGLIVLSCTRRYMKVRKNQ
jgi:hypothetical protein